MNEVNITFSIITIIKSSYSEWEEKTCSALTEEEIQIKFQMNPVRISNNDIYFEKASFTVFAGAFLFSCLRWLKYCSCNSLSISSLHHHIWVLSLHEPRWSSEIPVLSEAEFPQWTALFACTVNIDAFSFVLGACRHLTSKLRGSNEATKPDRVEGVRCLSEEPGRAWAVKAAWMKRN